MYADLGEATSRTIGGTAVARQDSVIAVMPFGTLERASIAAAMIQGHLKAAGSRCHVDYANLRFAERIGIVAYDFFSRRTDATDLIGEWLFSESAFGKRHRAGRFLEEYIARQAKSYTLLTSVFGCRSTAELERVLNRFVAEASRFVDEVAQHVLRMDPDIVGATTIFQQNTASIALLRRIKDLRPTVTTILGGANCEEPMGSALEKICPWIDVVHKGRVEGHLNRLFDLEGADPDSEANAVYPDLSGYFDQLEASGVSQYIHPALPIEMSTGCWYGEKQHCTFCGLNANNMRFKFRDAGDVLDELKVQSKTYKLNKFMAVDNIIALNYFDTLLPMILKDGLDIHMFVETKANLKTWQVDLMAEAGFDWIQPGIESLDNDKLKRFKKGTDLKTNLTLLKLSMERGIVASWLLLVNDPGEDPDEYRRMAALFPKLTHLQPPANIVRIRFDRYSPYHARHSEFGLNLEPYHAYSYVYPEDADLNDLAYYFEDYGHERVDWQRPEMQELHNQFINWTNTFYGVANGQPRELKANAKLTLDPATGVIVDTRRREMGKKYRVGAKLVEILEAVHEGMPKVRFRELYGGVDISALLDRGLIIDTGDHYLSLATYPPKRGLPKFEDFPCGTVMTR